jgi:hypothetical protein
MESEQGEDWVASTSTCTANQMISLHHANPILILKRRASVVASFNTTSKWN